MIHDLAGGRLQATLLNFSARTVEADVTSQHLPPGAQVIDASTRKAIGRVSPARSFPITMQAHQGLSVMLDM